MARVTALSLRTAARETMIAAGGRGFMRFLPPGGALLATDAVRRCESDAQKKAMIDALDASGFDCHDKDGLLTLTPTDELLGEIVCGEGYEIDWASPMHRAQALGVGWARRKKKALTQDGRQLILEALRLGWQTPKQTKDGLDALRVRAAVMLRRGDDSGFYEAGAVLLDWCDQYTSSTGGNVDEA